MKCPNCGWPHPPGTAMCRCGTSLANGARAASPPSPASKLRSPVPRPAFSAKPARKGLGPKGMLALGLTGLALSTVSLFFLGNRWAGLAGIFSGLGLVAKGFQGLDDAPGSSTRLRAIIWRAPWLSFYSGTFYDDVARRGRGVGALYLLALEALTWLGFMIAGYLVFHGFLANEGQRLIAQIPPIAIKAGRVQVDAPQPYYIRFEENKQSKAMVLDTTGEIASLEARPDLLLLLARDKLHIRQSSGEVRIHDLSRAQSFEMNQTILRSWIDRYTVPFFVVGYALTVLGAFCYRLLQALLYAAIGLGFASMFGKSLSYGESLRLAIAAVTPVILIETILVMAKVPAAGFLWWLLCLGTTLGFLAFGVKSLSDE